MNLSLSFSKYSHLGGGGWGGGVPGRAACDGRVVAVSQQTGAVGESPLYFCIKTFLIEFFQFRFKINVITVRSNWSVTTVIIRTVRDAVLEHRTDV